MASPGRHALARWAARMIPALLLLYWSFHLALPLDTSGTIDWGALVRAFDAPLPATLLWVVTGFLLFGATLALAALRFHVLMRAARVPSDFASAWRLLLVATFFNTVLPGGVLGDAWRVWQGHDRLRRGPAVLGVVTLERVLGLQALGLIALCGAPWVPTDALPAGVLGALVGVCALCAFGPFALLHPAAAKGLRRGVDLLPERFARVKRVSLEAGEGLTAVRGDSSRTAVAIATSLACQAVPVVAVVALAQPLVGDVAVPWFAVVVPVTTLASMLPISVGGTGVRELLFVSLFSQMGMPAEAALALGLLTGLVNLGWAGIGGLLFSLDRDEAPS